MNLDALDRAAWREHLREGAREVARIIEEELARKYNVRVILPNGVALGMIMSGRNIIRYRTRTAKSPFEEALRIEVRYPALPEPP